jgi:aminoglycoside 3-N-acetyltransferase
MKRTSQAELYTLLSELGVVAGDQLFIHAFLPSLGVVEGGITGLTEVIQERLGERGTIIVPTFSASYRRNEIYDVRESKSFNGALSEYIRQLPMAVRSLDPLFSMAALGRRADELMERTGSACFGDQSIYEKLFRNDVKFIGFGVDWNQGYSFFMHLERLANVPFRHEVLYRGQTRRMDGVLIDDEAVHFVRNERLEWKRNRQPVCEQLLSEGKIEEVSLGGCFHRLFESSVVEKAVMGRLHEDPWCMTDQAAG